MKFFLLLIFTIFLQIVLSFHVRVSPRFNKIKNSKKAFERKKCIKEVGKYQIPTRKQIAQLKKCNVASYTLILHECKHMENDLTSFKNKETDICPFFTVPWYYYGIITVVHRQSTYYDDVLKAYSAKCDPPEWIISMQKWLVNTVFEYTTYFKSFFS